MVLLIGLAHASTIWTVTGYRDDAWREGAVPGDVVEFHWASDFGTDWIGTGILVETEGLTFRGATPETEMPPLWFDGVDGTVGPGRLTMSSLSFGTTSTPHYVALRADDASIVVDTVSFEGVEHHAAAPANPTHPVWLIDADVEFRSTTFSDCSSDDPDYPYIVASENTSGAVTLTFTDVIFSGSGSTGGVAVISTAGSADVDVTGSVFRDLYAENGGAIRLDSGDARLHVEGSDFEFNRAGSAGGSIYVQNGADTTLADVSCTSGWSYTGGCLYQLGGTLDVERLVAAENTSTAGGAVIAAHGVDTVVRRSQVCRSSSGVGGDLFAVDGALSLQNSVFQGGSSSSAVSSQAGNGAVIENVTFSGNIYGAVEVDAADPLRMFNTLVEGSDVGLAVHETSLDELDYNLWFDVALPVDGADPGSHAVFEEPLYEAFDPNDCSTLPIPRDYSPVIDAGDPSLEDVWGGRSDIGMYGGSGSEDIGGRMPQERTGDSGRDSGDSDVDTGVEPDRGTPGAIWVTGGCHGVSGAAFILLGLLLRRRR
ncbi:MAG: hypothetical protein GY913_29015 [Proteobacteria bacterium]|nr:hypothetical protein [Pseudomonadota bacterium]MCP4920955.1 hypothetical protein [Pseudomonadota bacterium]